MKRILVETKANLTPLAARLETGNFYLTTGDTLVRRPLANG